MQQTLFDKYVNLHLRTSDGTEELSIITPDDGMKPTIRVKGEMKTQNYIQDMEVRVTNLRTARPLSDYGTIVHPGYIAIEAGYRNGLDTLIKGQVINSFQETPGPDGVTTLQMLYGIYTDWLSKTINKNYGAGSVLEDVVADIASTLNLNLRYAAAAHSLPRSVSFNGKCKDLLDKLSQMFFAYDNDGRFVGVRIMPIGHDLVCWDAQGGTGVVHKLDFVTNASHFARGFDIVAPWVPSIRPGDQVQVDPSYFRQDLGGSAVETGNLFTVYSIAFEFCTDDDTNQMTLMTLGAA
jgi:hypothetical protein